MIKIGIVGAGIIGISHKEAIMKHVDCELTAVCDVDITKALELAKGTNANTYEDYRDMCENENLDGVILNLPHYLHKNITIYFLEHKIPTLVEKPMALNVSECDAMIEASKGNKTPLGIGHVQQYFKSHKYLKKLIENKELGEFCSMTETRNVSYFPNRPKWFLNKEQAGGGILMNYGAHTLDKLYYLTGLNVEKVIAVGNNFLNDENIESSAQVLLKLSNGCSAALTYCGCEVPFHYEAYYYFTNGAVRLIGTGEMSIAKGSSPFQTIEVDGTDDIMYDQLNEFVKLIRGEENELITPEYGKKVIEVLEKAFVEIEK